MTLLRYAFYSRGLNRVYLRVLASNKSALSCYQHCGFREEGRMRSHVFKLGRWVDVIVMGLLREEFEVANPIFPGENSIS